MNAAAPLLQVSDMTKRFPGVLALDGIGLTVERGTIHGLLGENGAGKSTLLKILAGEYRSTSGRIQVDGEEVEIASPRHAHSLGIGIVYQELSLLRNLSVAHNISLANEPTRALAIDERAIVGTARESLGRMGIHSIDPTQKVGSISIAERQLVEIAKVLTLRRPRILIFDEPTAALGPADVARLFRIMGELRDQGVAIIFVSHRYREVLTICDRATVLRNGRVVGDVDCRGATVEHLVELTLGQKAETVFRRNWRAAEPGDPVLVVRDLEVAARVRGVDLELRRGEIVGVCGLLGSGQNELARALAGDLPDVSGTVAIEGRTTTVRNPRQAFRAGLALITENRQEEGLFPDMSVRSNISIASLPRVLVAPFVRVISRRAERRLTRGVSERTGIAVTFLSRRVKVLSGGNQQKSLLARWLMHRSDVFVLIEPTRGVDVGAKLEIYRRLEEVAADGAGVLVVSTDVPEVVGISDRIAVLYAGRITEILEGESATEQQVLVAIQGGVSAPAAPMGAASP